MANDREVKTQATVRARNARIGLPKALEHVRQQLRRDPRSIVPDGDLDRGIHTLDPYLDAPTLGRELNGVGEQVPDDLPKAVGVA